MRPRRDSRSAPLVAFAILAVLALYPASCAEKHSDKGGNSTGTRIAFRFVGAGGSDQGLDDIQILGNVGDQQTVILKEGFEQVAAMADDDDDLAEPPAFPPKGWRWIGENPPPYSWFVGGPTKLITEVAEGDWMAEVFGANYYQNEVLITPRLKLSGYDAVTLHYQTAGSVSLSNLETLVVEITIDDGRSWAEIDRFSADNDTGDFVWNQHDVDITDPAGFFKD